MRRQALGVHSAGSAGAGSAKDEVRARDARLPEIKAPTLVIVGQRDLVCSPK
jgi:pimeloyl-ACP methyl ester carboxylesterase